MKKTNPLHRGIYVFVALAILTGIEYLLAINEVPQILLWTIALVKLVLVMQFFMHIYRLFRAEDGSDNEHN